MVRHNLATRSLRHLRFARQMMAGQPLLRAADGSQFTHLSAAASFASLTSGVSFVSLGGRQLPLGRVLRRLPATLADWPDVEAASDLPTDMPLRLLPRLREAEPSLDETSAGQVIEPETWQPATSVTPAPLAPPASHMRDERSPVLPASPGKADMTREPRMPAPARTDGLRPRSRIVELPGIISRPLEDEASDSAAAPDAQPDDEPATLADAADAADVPEMPVAEASEEDAAPPSPASDPGEQFTVAPVESESAAPAVPSETPPTPAPRRRGGKRAAPSRPARLSDTLFPPTDADRSPQTWLARLQQAGKPAPDPHTTPSAPVRSTVPAMPDDEPPSPTGQRAGKQAARPGGRTAHNADASHTATRSSPPPSDKGAEWPAPLPDSSRALLREMTAIDPVDVPVYRGPEAGRVTSAQNADALTDGGAIALGAGHATDTPETLGLLAHELTHVAHRRDPRFVPPVAKPPARPASTPLPATAVQSPVDEEALAAQVEARVTSIARARSAPPAAPRQAVQRQSEPSDQPDEPLTHGDTRPIWGNLPAPWEPLPDWMASPTRAPESAPRQPVQPAQPPTSTLTPARPPSADTSGVQRAERGRSLPASESSESSATQASPTHEGGAPEPDLDALAQQVHAILKRRLAAERRRFG